MNGRLASIQDWAIGIDRRTGSLTVLGVVLAVFVVACMGVVFALFTGAFTAYDAITVRLPLSSTSALPGSSVQFRDVSVGKVVGQGRTGPDGTTIVTVHLNPGQLKNIPASVRAAVLPISIFGNQYVVLQPPADPGSEKLKPGATVQAQLAAPTTSVQQTVTSLDRALTALHPAELNVALTALAQALQGQGKSLGETSNLAATYLGAIQPLWPQVVQNLGLLAPVANQIAASTPDIVGLLGNSLTTAATLNGNPGGLHQLLAGSGAFADQAQQLSVAIEQPFSLLSAASGPFLEAVASRPDNISKLLDGLDGFATSVTAAGAGHSYLATTATVQVLNVANLATAALGGSQQEVLSQLTQGLGSSLVNPPTYTSGLTLPPVQNPVPPPTPAVSQGSPVGGLQPQLSAGTTSAGTALGGTGFENTDRVMSVLAADSQRAAVTTITTALSGAEPASADAATLLLSPLLMSLGQQ